jgi:flagella basal body P-ring formation protein FlgA
VKEKRQALLPIKLKVQGYQRVVIPNRSLVRGEMLTAEKLTTERRPVETYDTSVSLKLEELIGKRLTRAISARQALRRGDVEVVECEAPAAQIAGKPASVKKEIVVRRGSLVQAMTKSGPLNLIIRAEALGDGAVGQTIPVRNELSRAVLSARVIDGQTVEVER